MVSVTAPPEEQILSIGKQEIHIWRRRAADDPLLFDQLFQLIFHPVHRVAWHACWIIDHASEERPRLLIPYLDRLYDEFYRLKSGALKRHFTRIFARYPIPEKEMGRIIDPLISIVFSDEKIAVKANALELLTHIALQEPDFIPELRLILDQALETDHSKGMISKCRLISIRLDKVQKKRSGLK